MSDDADPIAYKALAKGTPVQSSDGQEFGTVEAVLDVEEVDVFDGLVVRTAEGQRFVDADRVGQIFTTHVVTTLSAAEAAELPMPDQDPVYDAVADDDTGQSLSDRFGRMFGRGKWKRER
ncbi:MAG TPA: hypothetical protein VGK78_17565 [Nocardioides sp.]|uniref:hypothetical protein n=1 Tax=Nocardioides sp. TaxID=35761 RepID=UPI002F42E90C